MSASENRPGLDTKTMLEVAAHLEHIIDESGVAAIALSAVIERQDQILAAAGPAVLMGHLIAINTIARSQQQLLEKSLPS